MVVVAVWVGWLVGCFENGVGVGVKRVYPKNSNQTHPLPSSPPLPPSDRRTTSCTHHKTHATRPSRSHTLPPTSYSKSSKSSYGPTEPQRYEGGLEGDGGMTRITKWRTLPLLLLPPPIVEAEGGGALLPPARAVAARTVRTVSTRSRLLPLGRRTKAPGGLEWRSASASGRGRRLWVGFGGGGG